ncbi:hypothetical protein JCM12296A_11550 [Desulfosarcina cetonica]
MVPVPSKSVLDEYYRNTYYSIGYSNSFFSPMSIMKNVYANMRAASQYAFIKKNTNLSQGSLVVELGCSSGNLLSIFRRNDYRVIGVELDNYKVQNAIRYSGLEVLQCSVEDALDMLDEKVDLFIFSHVLEHILEPKTILKKCNDLLVRGGYVYIEFPNSYLGKPTGKAWDEFKTILLESEHINNFSTKSISYLLSSCGFDVPVKYVFLSQKTAPILKKAGIDIKVDHILKKKKDRIKMYIYLLINTLYLAFLYTNGIDTIEKKERNKRWAGTNEWLRIIAIKERDCE